MEATTNQNHFYGLLIEDSEDTVALVEEVLRPECELTAVGSLHEAKTITSEKAFQFFIVDLNLPDGTGLDFCKMIRQNQIFSDTPIFILTADTSIEKELEGFDVGAIDYIRKPVQTQVLKKRIIQRILETQKIRDVVQVKTRFGDMTLDLFRGGVQVRDRDSVNTPRKLNLTATEFRLLYAFTRNQGHLLTKEELSQLVWGENENRALEQHLMQLRKKLGYLSQCIETKYGEGYISHFS